MTRAPIWALLCLGVAVGCKRNPKVIASDAGVVAAVPIASASVAPSVSVAPTPLDPLLYRATLGKGKPVHLFGSVHVANATFYPLPPKVEAAFRDSAGLAVEVHLDLATKLRAAQLVAKARYLAPDSLQKHVSEKTWRLLDGHPRRTLPMAMLAPQKPWIVAVTFLAKELERNGLDPDMGIDKHFVDAADASDKSIRSLETLEDQLGIFDTMPDATQELFLREALDEADLVGKQLAELTTAWKQGDAAALDKLLSSSYDKPEFKALQKQLITDRNVRMAAAVAKMLQKSEQVFVVVGVAHLIGPTGVVELLRHEHVDVVRE